MTTVLPVGLTAKAIQLCAAGFGAAMPTVTSPYAISVRAGAVLIRQADNEAYAAATVRDLLSLGADFGAGPFAITGQDCSHGLNPVSVFDPCALAHIDDATPPAPTMGTPTILPVSALLRRRYGARITDAVRPINATYGAVHSWHKVGQAIDFVPSAGVMSINRDEIRSLMAANGIRLLELLGPGDRGHSNHWHVAFAQSGQVTDGLRLIKGDKDWIVNAADAGNLSASTSSGTEAPALVRSAGNAPPQWDVFAAKAWRLAHGGGS